MSDQLLFFLRSESANETTMTEFALTSLNLTHRPRPLQPWQTHSAAGAAMAILIMGTAVQVSVIQSAAQN